MDCTVLVLSLCCFYRKKSELTSRKHTFLKKVINDFGSPGRLNSAKRTGCISPAYTLDLLEVLWYWGQSFFYQTFNSSGTGAWVWARVLQTLFPKNLPEFCLSWWPLSHMSIQVLDIIVQLYLFSSVNLHVSLISFQIPSVLDWVSSHLN